MAYFNDVDNANSYSPYSTSAGVYSYPFPTQTLATDAEGFNGQIYADPTDQWATDRWSGPMVESSTSLRAETSYGERHSNRFTGWRLTRESSRIGGFGHLVYNQHRRL